MARDSSVELDTPAPPRFGKMNTRNFFMAVGIFLILIGTFGIGIFHNLQKFDNKPIHSLRDAREAIENRDLEAFKKYVDTEALIGLAAKEILTEHINDTLAPTAYSMDELQIRYDQLKPDFINSARTALDEYIATGEVTFTDDLTDAQKFLKRSGVTSCEIKDFGKPHLIGNVMTSSVIFYNSQMKFAFELEIELEPADEINWRVTSARGFENYYNAYCSALRRKLNSLNAPIDRKMDEIFKVKSFSVKSSEGDEYGFSKTLDVAIKAEVYSEKPLEKIVGNVILVDKGGKENFSPFVIDMLDQPHGIQTFEVHKTLNPFVRADVDAMRHGLRKKDIKVEVTEIIFEDGTNLRLLDRLPD